jgi:hypothetical protein
MQQNIVYVMELWYVFIKISTFRTKLILSHIVMNIIDLALSSWNRNIEFSWWNSEVILTCLRSIVALYSHLSLVSTIGHWRSWCNCWILWPTPCTYIQLSLVLPSGLFHEIFRLEYCVRSYFPFIPLTVGSRLCPLKELQIITKNIHYYFQI